MKEHSRRFLVLRGCACVAAAALMLSVWPSEAGQKNKKNNSNASNDSSLVLPLPNTPQVESNTINEDIGEMLGAFQIGNDELMHKYYSDDCTFVQSTYDPPVIGWQKYAALYDREKAAFQGMQLIRRNTDIFVHGDVAWASYQWEFDGMAEGRPFTTRGQTTLVLTKANGNWLIVHNHTNEVMAEPTQQTTAAPPASPAQPTMTAAKP
ncbi:MAG TPA: nuclear transport factor 2 family protein [Candidatus Acidoferrales bacterium]|jgi:ketosteroid isomerase-like protein|nr:nuclear transport factor 2 family protein [Candidatus Acidoferrales bacterium]